MSRKQRRHRASFSSEEDMTREEDSAQHKILPEKTVEFLEVKGYRMIEEESEVTFLAILKKEEFSEEEWRKAFKKKLSKN